MRHVIYFSVLIFILGVLMPAQAQNTLKQELQELPNKCELVESSSSNYAVTTTHYDYQMMGPFMQKKQISGEFTRGLEDHKVRWNNVRIAVSYNLEACFEQGELQTAMEGFTYVPSGEMMNPEAFASLPQNMNTYLYKNLVWDMMAFDTFSWAFTDSLSLNKEYRAKEASYEIELAGEGTFENKDIRLTWIGVTQKNQKTCAIIKYSILNNPLSINGAQLKLKGRSHYWGNVYVCLETKQLEYAELYEDVIMDMKVAGMENNQLLNTVRTIYVERIRTTNQEVKIPESDFNNGISHLRIGSGTLGF
ncbi:hypothetical protein E9993_07595 [Labilibacter sediminis]|nr:hypothetical protein E9993_07595 [Labilibacter sediminis]